MSTRAVQGQSKLVAVFVAFVGAAAVIVAALITSGVFDDDDDDNGPATTESVAEAPDIGGEYHLDPGNPRVILVEDRGNDTYAVSERLPANWPFSGTVGFVGDDTFTGTARFDSGANMQVTMVVMPDGKLVTTFDFLTDDDGVSIERVDEHLLVPV